MWGQLLLHARHRTRTLASARWPDRQRPCGRSVTFSGGRCRDEASGSSVRPDARATEILLWPVATGGRLPSPTRNGTAGALPPRASAWGAGEARGSPWRPRHLARPLRPGRPRSHSTRRSAVLVAFVQTVWLAAPRGDAICCTSTAVVSPRARSSQAPAGDAQLRGAGSGLRTRHLYHFTERAVIAAPQGRRAGAVR